MDYDLKNTEAGTVAALVRASNTPLVNVEPSGLVVFPNGSIKKLYNETLDDFPARKRAKVDLQDTYSFVNYVNAHLTDKVTHIFGQASETGGHFRAIVDYHAEGNAGSPRWGEHVCNLDLVATPEWLRWIQKNQTPMTQEAFAEFLEDNLFDIVQPDAAALIDIVQLLTGKKSVNFKSGKNLKNGAITFEYSEAIETTGGRTNGDMQIPDRFTLGICPFVGADGVNVEARLRFRISDAGKLTFFYILNRPFNVIALAFQAARHEIESKTGLKVYLGTAQITNPTGY